MVPEDWAAAKSKDWIKASGLVTGDGFKFYDLPQGAPFKETLMMQAEIRVEFSVDKTARKTLPALQGFKFSMLNFTSKNVEPADLS